MRYLKMKRYQHCPKCNWMLTIEKDQYGWFVECISCGYMRDLKEVKAVDENITDSHDHVEERELSSAWPNNNSQRMI